MVITCKHVLRLYECFPIDVPGARLECIILCFARVHDLENFDIILEKVTDLEVAGIYRRLGRLNVWNPMRPDMFYDLNLGVPEDHKLCELMIKVRRGHR
jgi:hypothetical protein